jgi:hypothetical protein
MKNPEAHHMLPQEFENVFSKMGINIHEPKWGAWVEGGAHQHWSGAYNRDWLRWLSGHETASLADVIKQAQLLATQYSIAWP